LSVRIRFSAAAVSSLSPSAVSNEVKFFRPDILPCQFDCGRFGVRDIHEFPIAGMRLRGS